MAHLITANKGNNADVRVISLRKNFLPGQPFRVSALDSQGNPRTSRHCRQCGAIGEDNCYCYAHNTFISRGNDMSVYLQSLAIIPTVTKTPMLENGTHKSSGKRMTLDAYKSRLKNATNVGDSASPASSVK